jgi:hypothetical protein
MPEIGDLKALRDTLCITKEYSHRLRKTANGRRQYMSLLVLLTATQMRIESKEKGGSIREARQVDN